jgi:hypothetical protein
MKKKKNYTTSELIDDLRCDIYQIVPKSMVINGFEVKMIRNGGLSYKKLSFILCEYENRIKRIQRNIRANPEFKIAIDELNEWEERLKLIFDLRSEKPIRFINRYRELNKNLPISRIKGLKVLNYHPKLKLDFFERIESKEKAYWLGLLWAEVYLGTRGSIKLEINQKDEVLLDRYCKVLGLNLKFKKYRIKIGKKGPRTYVRIRFRNIKIQEYLYRLGYVKSSKKSTIFPKLDNRELDLAFLLGFFDGDGKEGTNQFHIGSRKILEQIKEKFNVPCEISTDKEGYYYLNLGGKLFNEMMTNYKNSLERKRRTFRIPIKEILKETISKKELEQLIWKLPLKEIAERYNAYPRIINELCDEWGIKKPHPHYWRHFKSV